MDHTLKKTISFITFDNVILLLLSLILLVMPYGIFALPQLLSLTFLIWFISLFFSRRNNYTELKQPIGYLLQPYSIIILLTIFYTSNIHIGLKVLERLISFMVLPFLFITIKNRIKLKVEYVYLLLGLSIFISFFVLIFRMEQIINIHELLKTGLKPSSFLNHIRFFIVSFSLALHPSYYSLLIVYYLSYTFFNLNWRSYISYIHLLFSIVGIVLLIMLFSRGAFLALFFLCLYALVKLVVQKRYIPVIVIISILLFSGAGVYKYTRLGKTVKALTHSNTSNQKDSRLIIWKNSMNVIKKSPVFGYGVGDALDVLLEEHKSTGYRDGVERQLDAHNQFLETWLQSGIFGLISLLLIFTVPLYHSIKHKQELLFLFLSVSLILLSFESMFIRLAGVVYFSFFYCYLFYYLGINNPKDNKVSNNV